MSVHFNFYFTFFPVHAAPAPSSFFRSPPLPFLLKLLTFHHSTPRVMAPKRKAGEAATSDVVAEKSKKAATAAATTGTTDLKKGDSD